MSIDVQTFTYNEHFLLAKLLLTFELMRSYVYRSPGAIRSETDSINILQIHWYSFSQTASLTMLAVVLRSIQKSANDLVSVRRNESLGAYLP